MYKRRDLSFNRKSFIRDCRMKVSVVLVGFLLFVAVHGSRPIRDNWDDKGDDVSNSMDIDDNDDSSDNDLDKGYEIEGSEETKPRRGYGKKDKDRPKPKPTEDCWWPMLDKTVTSLRGFPLDDSVMDDMNFDLATYEPMLESFWNNKDKDRSEAQKMFHTEFVTQLLQQRYKCSGTKFNQILLYVLEKEGRPYINRIVSETLKQVLAKLPGLTDRVNGFVQRIFDDDILGFVEEEEFESIGCFLRELKQNVFSKDVASLEDLKSKFKDAANQDDNVFTCTDPQEVLDYYKNGLEILNTPVRKNLFYRHLYRLLKGLLKKASGKEQGKSLLIKKLVKTLAWKLFSIFKESVKHLTPVLDYASESDLFQFLGKFMSDEKLRTARAIIEKLDLYKENDDGSGSIEDDDSLNLDDNDIDVPPAKRAMDQGDDDSMDQDNGSGSFEDENDDGSLDQEDDDDGSMDQDWDDNGFPSTTPSPVRRDLIEKLTRALEQLREVGNDDFDAEDQYRPTPGTAKRGM